MRTTRNSLDSRQASRLRQLLTFCPLIPVWAGVNMLSLKIGLDGGKAEHSYPPDLAGNQESIFSFSNCFIPAHEDQKAQNQRRSGQNSVLKLQRANECCRIQSELATRTRRCVFRMGHLLKIQMFLGVQKHKSKSLEEETFGSR